VAIALSPRVDVEARSRNVPRVKTLKRVEYGLIPDSIAISLGASVESRMKRCRHLAGIQNTHRRREMVIQGADDGGGIDVPLQGHVRDLTTRMDAGIRPTGADDCDWLSFEQRERLLEQLLNRRTRRLPLPSDELGPVVRERQLIGSHSRNDRA